MIPDVHLDALTLGPVRVHVFGVLLLLGIIAFHTALVRRARGLATPAVVEGFAVALGAGALGSGLTLGRLGGGGLSAVAGAAGAIVVGAGYAVAFRLDPFRFADAAAGAFPVGWLLARLGCALVHDHLGPRSSSWLSVAFASGPRLDVGLLEWLLTPLLLVAAYGARRSGRPGAVAGAVAVAYAAVRFPLDFLRVDDPRFGGLTAMQWGTMLLLAGGAALLYRAARITATP